jgi:hypothetical protein
MADLALLVRDSAFLEGFSKSALMILVSEIGDKTFFIAAVMAMRHPQLTARGMASRARAFPLAVTPFLTLCGARTGADGRAGRAVGHDGAVRGDGLGSARVGARPRAAMRRNSEVTAPCAALRPDRTLRASAPA